MSLVNEAKEFKKEVIKMFRGERSHDFFKCFKDMSFKEASRICGLPIGTLKTIRHDMHDTEWNFIKMRGGYQMNKWHEIKKFREEMMKDEDFKPFRGLLEHAARVGAAMQKICVPKLSEIEAISLFENGAREAADARKRAAPPPAVASPPIPAYSPYPQPDPRNWSVFTSLNAQERAQAWFFQQQRLAAMARQAVNIFDSLPPPVPITAPVPHVPPPKEAMPSPPVPPPKEATPPPQARIEAPPPQPLPKRTEKVECCNAGTQACSKTALDAMKDQTLWRDVTPREINGERQDHAPFYEGTDSKALQLRSWMLLQSMVFDDSSRYIKAIYHRWLKERGNSFTRTPDWALDTDVRRFVFYGTKNMQLDPELAALPDLEPITDWGWLLTMGLAQP